MCDPCAGLKRKAGMGQAVNGLLLENHEMCLHQARRFSYNKPERGKLFPFLDSLFLSHHGERKIIANKQQIKLFI